MSLLEVRDARVAFGTPRGLLRAVDGVNVEVNAGEAVALVGESGCGKSTLARGIVGLEPLAGGEVLFEGADLSVESRLCASQKVQLVFQDPDASLNPRMTIRSALLEPLTIHRRGVASTREQRVVDLLGMVGIDSGFLNRYPHELSGGQKQRICIARALAVEPRLLILDEAVSALDVSVQAQILGLLWDLKEKLSLAYLFITHDLRVVENFADRVYVMYLGQVQETSRTERLFKEPLHPYSQALLEAVPRLGQRRRPKPIHGDVPSPLNPPSGCRFHPRCPKALPDCATDAPRLFPTDDGEVRCFLYDSTR